MINLALNIFVSGSIIYLISMIAFYIAGYDMNWILFLVVYGSIAAYDLIINTLRNIMRLKNEGKS